MKAVNTYRLGTARYRLLPQFLIIGGLKCGTTSLYEYVCQHPEVKRAQSKEVFFFDKFYQNGLAWYQSKFPFQSGKRLTGEASPHYIHHPWVPQRVKEFNPEIKLIAILRNPVDRIYSHYKHNVRNGWETLSFEDALDSEEERVNTCMKNCGGDPNAHEYGAMLYSYFWKGVYANQLARWFELFSPEQILVLQSETLFEFPRSTVNQVFRFIGLDDFYFKSLEQHNKAPQSQLKLQNRNRLVERYQAHNERLFEMLGESFDWK